MKTLQQYILESYDDYLKLSAEDKKRLLKLDIEYGELMLIARYETVCRRINNVDEEWDKFEKSYIDGGKKYYPTVEHKELNYEKYDLKNRVNELIEEFQHITFQILNLFLIKLNILSHLMTVIMK